MECHHSLYIMVMAHPIILEDFAHPMPVWKIETVPKRMLASSLEACIYIQKINVFYTAKK